MHKILAVLAGVVVFLYALPLRGQTSEPFGYSVGPINDIDMIKYRGLAERWHETGPKLYRDIFALNKCEDDTSQCTNESAGYLNIVQEARRHEPFERIEYVNRVINQLIEPVSDMAHWFEPDHWSPPLETLQSRKGDCEDYVLAKYTALMHSGVLRSDLKIVIVDIPANDTPKELHAILAVRHLGVWLMLDNSYQEIRIDTQIMDYVPVLVLDYGSTKQYEIPAAVVGVN